MPLTEIIIPPPLQPKDLIGIIAPASHFNKTKFEKGLEVIKNMGFRLYVHEDIYKKNNYFAGSDMNRLNMIHSMFSNPEIKAIICARGGFGSMKLLPDIDYNLLRQNPKRFVGFSDITGLLCAFYKFCNMAVFHGPMVSQMYNADDKTLESLYISLTKNIPDAIYKDNVTIVNSGKAFGPIIGGNLTILCHLLGTPFAPNFGSHILFIEDRGEAAYRIERMLTHLQLSGCFEKIKGVIIGSFSECGEYNKIIKLIKNLCSDKTPIVSGIECGHCIPNFTLPFGINVTVDI